MAVKRKSRSKRTRFCPTPGCNGRGNSDKRYIFHYTVRGCPNVNPPLATFAVGNRKKGVRTKRVVMDISETPVLDAQQVWHYFFIIVGKGSADIRLVKHQ